MYFSFSSIHISIWFARFITVRNYHLLFRHVPFFSSTSNTQWTYKQTNILSKIYECFFVIHDDRKSYPYWIEKSFSSLCIYNWLISITLYSRRVLETLQNFTKNYHSDDGSSQTSHLSPNIGILSAQQSHHDTTKLECSLKRKRRSSIQTLLTDRRFSCVSSRPIPVPVNISTVRNSIDTQVRKEYLPSSLSLSKFNIFLSSLHATHVSSTFILMIL